MILPAGFALALAAKIALEQARSVAPVTVYTLGTAVFVQMTQKEVHTASHSLHGLHMGAAVGVYGEVIGALERRGGRVYCIFTGQVDAEGIINLDACVEV